MIGLGFLLLTLVIIGVSVSISISIVVCFCILNNWLGHRRHWPLSALATSHRLSDISRTTPAPLSASFQRLSCMHWHVDVPSMTRRSFLASVDFLRWDFARIERKQRLAVRIVGISVAGHVTTGYRGR